MKNIKNIKKLKIIAIFLIILLITILFLVNIIKNNTGNQKEEKQTMYEYIKSENYRMVKDYLNPTSEEIAKLYSTYGRDNVQIVEEGIIIKPDDYSPYEERLFTDVWPERELTNKIKKPESGKINLIEVAETYVIIKVKKISEKEVKEYISEIKDEYTIKEKNEDKQILYSARNTDDVLVTVKFDGKLCTIKYSGF